MVINTLCIHSWEQLGIMQFDEWLEVLEEVPQMRLCFPEDVDDLGRYGAGHMNSLELLQLAAGEMVRSGELHLHTFGSCYLSVRRAAHRRHERHDRGQFTEGEREQKRESERRWDIYIESEREREREIHRERERERSRETEREQFLDVGGGCGSERRARERAPLGCRCIGSRGNTGDRC